MSIQYASNIQITYMELRLLRLRLLIVLFVLSLSLSLSHSHSYLWSFSLSICFSLSVSLSGVNFSFVHFVYLVCWMFFRSKLTIASHDSPNSLCTHRTPSVSQYYEFSKDQDYICSTPNDSGMHLCGNFPPYRIGSLVCNGKSNPKPMP